MTKRIVPIGTEIRASEIGYYDYWYPAKQGHTLQEEIEYSKEASINELKFSTGQDWTPLIVSSEIAEAFGSPIRVLWIKKNVNT